MNYIKGDLIKLFKDKHFDVLIHGCNCFCTMGKGDWLVIESIIDKHLYGIDCTCVLYE